MALHINRAQKSFKRYYSLVQVREKKEILRSKAPFKKHAVTKQPGPSSSSFRKKFLHFIADASTNTGQFINTAK